MNKKKIMLVCDVAAAAGSLILLMCASFQVLALWVLCVVNGINGLMNAFQGPAFQVSVTLLLEKEDYAKAGGLQSALGAVSGMLSPILAAALLGFGGLQLVLAADLATFAFAFFILLLFIRIPDCAGEGAGTGSDGLGNSIKTAASYLRGQKSILLLLVMYSVLEFWGPFPSTACILRFCSRERETMRPLWDRFLCRSGGRTLRESVDVPGEAAGGEAADHVRRKRDVPFRYSAFRDGKKPGMVVHRCVHRLFRIAGLSDIPDSSSERKGAGLHAGTDFFPAGNDHVGPDAVGMPGGSSAGRLHI